MPKADDTAVNEPVVAGTTTTESAPVEETTTVAEEKDVMELSLDELSEDTAEETESEDSEEVTPSEETAEETEELPQDGEKPLAPKSENRFQKLANENRELREQLAENNARKTQVATEQELLNQINPETGDYFTPQEAERIARYQANEQKQQSLAEEEYNLQVRSNQQTIAAEAQEVLQEFPMFSPFVPGTEKIDPSTGQLTGAPNPQYNPVLSERAAALLEGSLIRHPQIPEIDPISGQPTGKGMIIDSQLSPKQIYKTIADSISVGATQGQIQGQKAAETMLANADVSANASQATKTKVDPMLAAFDEEASK